MTFRLGLTGSIGMGKTTTAAMFAEAGVPIWDADAAVARLYAPGGAAIAPMSRAFPEAIVAGAVSKEALKSIISARPEALKEIEAIVHPLVAADRQAFVDSTGAPIALFDIPLLYETGADAWLDAVAVVTTSEANQRARVLSRGTMTEAQLDLILARQMPDAEKRRRADFIIPTDTLETARAAVDDILRQIGERLDA